MADPYRQQYGPPPAWPPQAPPPPPKRRGRGLTIALSIFAGLAVLVGVVTIIGLTVGGDDTPTDSNTPQPASTPASPAPNPSEARPGVDVGAGTPGAGCATSRLGWFFVKDGVTYVCQGPAPNRWLPKG